MTESVTLPSSVSQFFTNEDAQLVSSFLSNLALNKKPRKIIMDRFAEDVQEHAISLIPYSHITNLCTYGLIPFFFAASTIQQLGGTEKECSSLAILMIYHSVLKANLTFPIDLLQPSHIINFAALAKVPLGCQLVVCGSCRLHDERFLMSFFNALRLASNAKIYVENALNWIEGIDKDLAKLAKTAFATCDLGSLDPSYSIPILEQMYDKTKFEWVFGKNASFVIQYPRKRSIQLKTAEEAVSICELRTSALMKTAKRVIRMLRGECKNLTPEMEDILGGMQKNSRLMSLIIAGRGPQEILSSSLLELFQTYSTDSIETRIAYQKYLQIRFLEKSFVFTGTTQPLPMNKLDQACEIITRFLEHVITPISIEKQKQLFKIRTLYTELNTASLIFYLVEFMNMLEELPDELLEKTSTIPQRVWDESPPYLDFWGYRIAHCDLVLSQLCKVINKANNEEGIASTIEPFCSSESKKGDSRRNPLFIIQITIEEDKIIYHGAPILTS